MFHVCVYRGFEYNEARVIEADSCRKAVLQASALVDEADISYARHVCEKCTPLVAEANRFALDVQMPDEGLLGEY